MKITQKQLYKIILEEYAKEEGLDEALSPEKAAELIAWIKGKGPRPEWATDDYGSSGLGKSIQSPMDPGVDRAADTMAFSAPDETSDEISPEPETSNNIEDQIAALVQGMPPEEVSDLFQAVFSKIPGVEIGPPEEEGPESLYSPGAEGRPTISLGPLREAVFQKLIEMGNTNYRGLGSAYKRDDGGCDNEQLSDSELVDQAYKDGIEEIVVLDGEGDLVNREEVLAAMKYV